MYKVLIADDERLIRITLKNMIDWKAFDCEVVGTAKDGDDAWSLYQDLQPEIVITDLKMPGMNGIELITKIKKHSKNTQVIALSNYSDFDYVRDAMKGGAFDYLLKVTLEKKDLESIVTQVKGNCKALSESGEEVHESALKELRQCLILMKNEHVIAQDDFAKALAQPCFQEYQKGYQMAYLRVDNVNHLYQNKIKDHAKLMTHLEDLIKESIPVSMQYVVLFMSNHSGIVLFNSLEKLRVLNICNSMIRSVNQYLDIPMSITLSDAMPSLDSFSDTFGGLLKAHDIRFYEGESSLIQSEEHRDFQELNMNEIQFHLEILNAVKSKNFTQVVELQDVALHYMQENCVRPQQVLEYFIFIFNNIEGNEIAKGTRHAIAFDKLAAGIRLCETMDKLKEVLEKSFQQIEEWMRDRSTNKYRQDILEIMEYVDSHLDQRLTLTMIAEHFDSNESTLSRNFKNETGKNLKYYINEHKMKKAMDLLNNDSGMIKEVALAVGMDDQLYFNKVFKKFYNIAPSEVKKNSKQ